ncbi:hypothetical protein T4B_12207 [Trichinella pseudospiralis]|uniref:Uncharacterized protein n=2 Tax=Trichinella pseudospiralis TaxID=6337 RepID=A0A0V1JFQ6_TRIPS|nr:hypothetical protein T4B_12207 [Trichinella pseudospiralis]
MRSTVCFLLKKANSTLPNQQLAMIRLTESASNLPDVLMDKPAADWGQLRTTLGILWQPDVFTYLTLERVVSQAQYRKSATRFKPAAWFNLCLPLSGLLGTIRYESDDTAIHTAPAWRRNGGGDSEMRDLQNICSVTTDPVGSGGN